MTSRSKAKTPWRSPETHRPTDPVRLLRTHRLPATQPTSGSSGKGIGGTVGNDDRGQLLPMVALLVVMALGLAVLIVETARLVGERGGP